MTDNAGAPPTTMWEVRAAAGRSEELLGWLAGRLPAGAQLYRSAAGAERVVVLDPSGTAATVLADPPADLVARPAQAWDFLPVRY